MFGYNDKKIGAHAEYMTMDKAGYITIMPSALDPKNLHLYSH